MFNLFSFIIFTFITAFTPGPNNIMSMTNATQFGIKKSIRFNFGILVGFLIVMIICAIFSTSLYHYIPKVKHVLGLVGSIYMLYLAYRVYQSTNNNITTSNSSYLSFQSGLVLQFVNPKIYVYALTAYSTFILPFYNSFAINLFFSMILSLIGFVGTIAWALFGSIFTRYFSSYNLKYINTAMAILLVYCAISTHL